MARMLPPEFLDPRSITDPAWGGLRETRSEVSDVDPSSDDVGDETWSKFSGALDDPGERVRGRFWRSRRKRAVDVMTTRPRTVRPDSSLQEIAAVMIDEDTGIVPVVEGGILVGVVTDRDIVCRTVARGLDQKTAKARDLMSEELATVEEGASLAEVLGTMDEHQVRRICVVRGDGRLVGIVSMADIARAADVDYELQQVFFDISNDRSFWQRLR